MSRTIHHRYTDPVDLAWLRCADQLGIRIAFSDEVFASWDGKGTLTLCTPEHYDADDSLAQLILHEICHALVQGPSRRRQRDWGMDNTEADSSATSEHACHRLQAALTDLYGLRSFFAVTTDWRTYWDALPQDPLAGIGDEAVDLARHAWTEARRGPWSGPLNQALEATATIAEITRPCAPEDSLWHHTQPRKLENRLPLRGEALTCESCTWFDEGACIASEVEVAAQGPACLLWERHLQAHDCRGCGACCREGFHAVGVEDCEPIRHLHPELIHPTTSLILRPHGRCLALQGGEPTRWTCSVYSDRPSACRDFEVSSGHCLDARRRVGLSRLF